MEEATILAALPLAVSIARTFARRTGFRLEKDEAEAEGRVGLVIAAQTYDPTRGVPFELWVRRCVTRQLIEVVRQRLGRDPDNPKHNDWRWESLDQPMPFADSHLNHKADFDGGTPQSEWTYAVAKEDPAHVGTDHQQELGRLLEALPPRERWVIDAELAGLSVKERAETYPRKPRWPSVGGATHGVTKSMVWAVRNRALRRMRESVE
jgi:RNA polymerase sigma factor (sigma-70 family)